MAKAFDDNERKLIKDKLKEGAGFDLNWNPCACKASIGI